MAPRKRKQLKLDKTTLRNLRPLELQNVNGGTVLCLQSSGSVFDKSGANTCVSCFQDSNCYC